MENEILIYGGGGHAKVVVDCLLEQEIKIVSVIDENQEGQLLGIERERKYRADKYSNAGLVIAIGDNLTRKNKAATIGHKFANVKHTSSVVSSHSIIGTGCMILHNAVIQAGAKIGDHVIINTGAQVDHDCNIDSFVHLAPGAVLCGNVSVGEGTLVGAGARVIPGKKIGAWVIVGAGAVVIDDIPDFAVVVGNPSTILKYNVVQ